MASLVDASQMDQETDMASTIFSSPAVCDLANAVDEELRHRARRREHVLRLDKLLLHSSHQRIGDRVKAQNGTR